MQRFIDPTNFPQMSHFQVHMWISQLTSQSHERDQRIVLFNHILSYTDKKESCSLVTAEITLQAMRMPCHLHDNYAYY